MGLVVCIFQIAFRSASNAPASLRFWRIEIISRGVDPMAVSARTSSSTVAPFLRSTLRGLLLLHIDAGLGHDLSGSGAEWIRLADREARLNLNSQTALHHGYRGNLHVLTHDDCAGALVDDNLGAAIRLNR